MRYDPALMLGHVRPHMLVALLAALALGLALVNAPEHFYYALSEDKVLADSSHVEIGVVRALLAGLGVVCALGWVLFWTFRRSAPVVRLQEDYETFCALERERGRPTAPSVSLRFSVWALLVHVAAFLALLQTVRWSFTHHGRGVDWFDNLAMESGVWETLTAVCLAGAGVTLGLFAVRYRRRFATPISFWVPLSLGALFLFGAGEELSWGQHWVGFATPETIQAANTQAEANLHNLFGHWANNAQMAFCVLYIGALPLLCLTSSLVRYVVDRLSVPVAPLVLVPFAFLGTALDSRARFAAFWGSPPWRLSEAREMLFAVGVLCVAVAAAVYWRERFDASKRAVL